MGYKAHRIHKNYKDTGYTCYETYKGHSHNMIHNHKGCTYKGCIQKDYSHKGYTQSQDQALLNCDIPGCVSLFLFQFLHHSGKNHYFYKNMNFYRGHLLNLRKNFAREQENSKHHPEFALNDTL